MGLRIAIFEKDNNLRNLLEFFLRESEGFEVIGSYKDLSAVEEIIIMDAPDFLIMDINLPKRDCITAIPLIKALNPLIHVIIYTHLDEDKKIEECLYAGAEGYILKKSSPSSLIKAIMEIRNGGAFFSPEVAKKILLTLQQKARPNERNVYDLTAREAEVLKLLMKGHSVKFIADELHMAFDTCRTHLRNLYKKLKVNCGKEAIAKMLHEKLIT